MSNTLHCLVIMSRPVIGAIAALAACAALWLVQPSANPTRYLLVATVLFAITSAGFVINDYFDIEKDKLNEPQRPLPSGRLKPSAAYFGALTLFIVGNIAAVFLTPMAFAVTLFNSFLLYHYSRILVWNGIIGNLVTAYLSASICFFGAAAGGVCTAFVIPSLFVFTLVMLREIIFDLQDQKGDAAIGMKTLATIYGSACVFRVAWALLGALGAMGIWFCIRQNIWSLLLIIACLTLVFIGLLEIHRKGLNNGYSGFVSLTRWSMLVMIPAFVMASPRFAWATESFPEAGSRLIAPGAVGYIVVGLAIAFYYISSQLLDEFNTMSRESFDRMDPRWRFYSVYGGLMMVIMVQVFAYAWHASMSKIWFFQAFVNEPHGARYLALAIGFIALPVLWLELLYSQHWANIGFTPYYESNLGSVPFLRGVVQHHDEVRRGVNKFPHSRLVRDIYSLVVFLISWLVYYTISPLFFIHLIKNLKRSEIDRTGKRWLQSVMDIFVVISLMAFYVAIFASFFPNYGTLREWLVWAPLVLTLTVIIIGSLGVWLVRPLDYNVADYGINIHFLLAFYALFLLVDIWGINILSMNWIMGGLAPWALFFFLTLLSYGFLRDLTEARRRTAEYLREGLTVNFVDRVIHKVSNLLQPPQAALQTAREWLESDDKLNALAAKQNIRQEVLRSLDNGLYSIQESVDHIRGLKATVREDRMSEWFNINDLFEVINTELNFAHGIRKKPIVNNPPDLELLVNKEQFSAVMQNLVENAADALRIKGHVNPEIRIQVSYDPMNAAGCEILVSDNGPGIKKEHNERVFEPWFSTKSHGSGMGLFIVQQFMKEKGGTVELRSRTAPEKQAGTQFLLHFPPSIVRTARNR